MVICIFGESCTGKSTIANEISQKIETRVFTGKDYLKLAKNENLAVLKFMELLSSHESSAEVIIYIVTEKEYLKLLPEKSIRVLVRADLEVIKERFARRTNGILPAPVAAMLEKRHGTFDGEMHHIYVDGGDESDICGRILDFCGLNA